MSRLKGAMLCVAAATLISTPGHAQITGHPIEVSADAGYFHYDIRAYTRDAPGYGGSVGLRLALDIQRMRSDYDATKPEPHERPEGA